MSTITRLFFPAAVRRLALRERAFRVIARQRECIGMAHARSHYSQQYLAFTRLFDFDFLNHQWFFRFPRDGCTTFHSTYS